MLERCRDRHRIRSSRKTATRVENHKTRRPRTGLQARAPSHVCIAALLTGCDKPRGLRNLLRISRFVPIRNLCAYFGSLRRPVACAVPWFCSGISHGAEAQAPGAAGGGPEVDTQDLGNLRRTDFGPTTEPSPLLRYLRTTQRPADALIESLQSMSWGNA